MKNKNYFIENLDRAIEERWIRVFYQPIVRSTTGKICAQEALSRWADPDGTMYFPDEFIPVLEEAGLTCRLDLYVLERVLERFQMQKEMDMPDVRLSVNLSGKDFSDCDIAEEIRKRVDAAGIPKNLLAFELAENLVREDVSLIRKQIGKFREMGFEVWLDGFGKAGFSFDLFRRISVDLIKFDMDDVRSFDLEESGRIILSELMKMTIGLGIDAVCEGVETEEEARFLQEIGCEKLQGYLYGEAVSFERICKYYRNSDGIMVEAPEESAYYDEIGRINLYDLDVIANKEEDAVSRFFNTIPIAIMEVGNDTLKFVRSNQSYRDFVRNVIGVDISDSSLSFPVSRGDYENVFLKLVSRCCKKKDRTIVNEKLRNQTTVRSFIRWLADNPTTGAGAVAVAVLSVSDAEQETSYENIARALAADYINLFYVDLDTGSFMEYSSDAGGEELAIERSGTDFFNTLRRDAREKILEDDQENFLFFFTRENILGALKTQGTFTMTFHMFIHGEPVRVNMKARRMQPGDNHLIVGINIIDEQAKLEKGYERKVIAGALNGTEAAKLDALSLDAASFAVKSCARLLQHGDFKENARAVLTDIMERAQADSARIMLVDKEKKEVSIFTEVNREGCFPNRSEEIAALRYDVIAAWEDLIGENNAIIVENEEDRRQLEQTCPEWSRMMKEGGSKCHVLVPLRREESVYGYLYVLNYNTRRTEKIRELIELVSYFLSSEISNYLFRQELEIISNYDQLTGLKNRHCMFLRIRRIEETGGCSCGILTMDLNGLKKINDTLGHIAGDELIRNAARVMEDEFGRDELYRIGGDEFIVLFPMLTEEEFYDRVTAFLDGRLKASGISTSYGTVWTEGSTNMEPFFSQADQNMYANKKAFYARQKKTGGSGPSEN